MSSKCGCLCRESTWWTRSAGTTNRKKCSFASIYPQPLLYAPKNHDLSQEFLLKRTTGLNSIARAGLGKVLSDPEAKAYALAVLDELNVSTPIAFNHKEKGAAAAAMTLLAPSALQVCLLDLTCWHEFSVSRLC